MPPHLRVPRHSTPASATSGGRLARFARPDCANQPVLSDLRLGGVDSQIDRSSHPSYGEVLADQIAGSDAAEIAGEAVSCRDQLY